MLAAAEAFAERGYCGVNLAEVVEGLGLTKGALYFYFPTKEAVAVEIVQRHFAAWEEVVPPILKLAPSYLDGIVAVSLHVAETYRTNPIARAGSRLSTERNLVNAELPEPYVGWIEKITKLLRSAKRAEELRPGVDVRALAKMIVSYFYGAQLVADHFNRRQSLPGDIEHFWSVVLPTVRA